MRYLMHRLMDKSGARSGLELMELLWSIWCRRDKTPLPSVGFTSENIDAQVQALRATDTPDEVFSLFFSSFFSVNLLTMHLVHVFCVTPGVSCRLAAALHHDVDPVDTTVVYPGGSREHGIRFLWCTSRV